MNLYDETEGPNSKGIAFCLWATCLAGVCGVHRFYLGKPWSGAVYLCTFGLFGIGQLIDLFRLPAMVAAANTEQAALRALAEKRALTAPGFAHQLPAPAKSEEEKLADVRKALVHAAAQNRGKLSVTQAVMATGKDFKAVEAILDDMARSGYVGIGNDDDTGAVVYTFGELG